MPQLNMTFEMAGLPELNARLDETAQGIAGPAARDALQAGGDIVKEEAQQLVRRKTGALADDIVAVVHMTKGVMSSDRVSSEAQNYVLIGAAWAPDFYRRVARYSRRPGDNPPEADLTTNPGLYGYFLEVGHRGPGQGLAHNVEYNRDRKAAKKQGLKVDSSKYGSLAVPPYPWLEPAFDASHDRAFEKMSDIIKLALSRVGK